MDNNIKPEPRMPSLAEIREMTPEQILNTRWIIDLNALSKTIQSNVDLLARLVADEKLIEWQDQINEHPEYTDEQVEAWMSCALNVLWIRGVRREVDRRAKEATNRQSCSGQR